MEWQTRVSFGPDVNSIRPSSGILCLGSCFANHLGEYLQRGKVITTVNPSGILFNPASIVKSLQMLMNQKTAAAYPEMLIYHDFLWHSLYHHGKFSHPDREKVLNDIDLALRNGGDFMRTMDFLIITMGTAYTYRHLTTGQIVANCHKIPSSHFTKELLQVDDICHQMEQVISELLSWRPDLYIILSVSPVRYLRDGLVNNNLSKAILLLAAHHLTGRIKNCSYFPAYELVVDELRDYRFYDGDMVHPSRQAIDYVMEKFNQIYFHQDLQKQVEDIRNLDQMMFHRPLHPGSVMHQQFLAQTKKKIETLREKYPHLDFSEEINKINFWMKDPG